MLQTQSPRVGPVEKRVHLFRLELASRMGEKVSLPELKTLAYAKCKDNLTISGVIGTLRILRAALGPDHHLTISEPSKSDPAGHAIFIRTDAEILSERLEKRPKTKRQIGLGLWHTLFKIELAGWVKESGKSITPALEKKLLLCRRRMNLAIMLDAGSTTLACFQSLLTVKSIPFSIKTDNGLALVRPHIFTNSVPIQNEWDKSRHKRRLRVTIVGGELFPDRMSVCGPLTDLCLESWRHVHTDISIIGSTACALDADGHRAFACDDINEAKVKRTMSGMGWIKVIVIDSSKLYDTPASHVFTKALQTDVDLVVTDDGASDEARAFIAAFLADCKAGGVSVVTVPSQD